jgi:hypothetical protein
MDLLTVILLISGISVTGITIGFVAKMALKPDIYTGKLKKNMDRYVDELEDENKHLIKQMNAMKKGARISKDDLENPSEAIASLIPQFEHLVPAKFKPFLRDPKLMEYATKMITENPEAAKKILSNFVSKTGANKALANQGEESNESISV